jgi:hypothetical protein
LGCNEKPSFKAGLGGWYYRRRIEIREFSNAQFQGWREGGGIATNPGNVNDYGLLEDKLRGAGKTFRICEVALRRENQNPPRDPVGEALVTLSPMPQRTK